MEKIKRPPKQWLLSWQGDPHNLRTEFMRDLLMFGKDIKVFLASFN